MLPFFWGLALGQSSAGALHELENGHDFTCCAICHRGLSQDEAKQDIGFLGQDYFKWWLCKLCLSKCQALGLPIKDRETLLSWMESTPEKIVVKTMRLLGFKDCYQHPRVDVKYAEILESIIDKAIID
jgi:hypothetical protein